jgi:hypothetical protein
MQRPLIVSAFAFFALVASAPHARAQAAAARTDHAAVGFALAGGPSTFGTGVVVTSPWLGASSLAVQAAAYKSWFTRAVGHDDDSGEAEETWSPFATYKLGIAAGSVVAGGNVRMYGVGGLLYLRPNAAFSTAKSVTGGYGAFGFEFLSAKALNFYLELGANGVGARAEKVPGRPLYANGFTTTVGFRYYL